MTYSPMTAFRRPFEPCSHVIEPNEVSMQSTDKWEIVREICVARTKLGVSDREITVLQALLSFHPGALLEPGSDKLVVFPSNAAICARLNGMACSTMRRHLAKLVTSGLIMRRDSPNGKRFARKYRDRAEAFGFDLSPLLLRHVEICTLAEDVRAEEEAYERLRRTVSLMRRDLAGVAAYGADTQPGASWDRFSDLAILTARALRRRLTFEDLQGIEKDLSTALTDASSRIEGCTGRMSTNDATNKQHHQNSNIDSSESEPCLEKQKAAAVTVTLASDAHPVKADEVVDEPPLPRLPLQLVMSACSEIQVYSSAPIRHWHDFVRAAETVRPMMGVSPTAWSDAVDVMGPEQASIVLAAILERMEDIAKPGGYLRSLTAKAALGAFSPGPMVMALLNRAA